MSLTRAARLFYRYHRFYWVGITVGLAVGRRLGLRLYQLRDLMIAVDGLLSAGFYLTLLATPAALILSVVTGNPIPLLAALALDLLYLALLRLERRLRRQHWLKRLSIYDVDHGSARTLRGPVLLGHVFYEEGRQRYWTHGHVDAVIQRARQATRWLTEAAAARGVALSFEHSVMTRGLRTAKTQNTDRLVEALRADADELLAAAMASDAAACLMVHVPHHTTSFAVPAILGYRPSLPLEWCLVSVYASAAVMAHELLHLFGADDHYYCRTQTELEAKMMLISRSVMFDAFRPISELVVDGVTAQAVGWA